MVSRQLRPKWAIPHPIISQNLSGELSLKPRACPATLHWGNYEQISSILKTIYRYFCRDPQLSNINPAPESTCPPSPWKPPAVLGQYTAYTKYPGPGCTRMAEHCIIHWRYCGSPVTEDTLVQHQGTSGLYELYHTPSYPKIWDLNKEKRLWTIPSNWCDFGLLTQFGDKNIQFWISEKVFICFLLE